jgi:hypothetical protein
MEEDVNNDIDIKLSERIAKAWVLLDFPHKEWPLISPEEQGMWMRDVETVMRAIHYSGLAIVEAEDGR